MNQSEAHRRRLLIAGAAGLGEAGVAMGVRQDASTPEGIAGAQSGTGTDIGAPAGLAGPAGGSESPAT